MCNCKSPRNALTLAALAGLSLSFAAFSGQTQIGSELAIPHRLQDGDEFYISLPALIHYGQTLFQARFTSQEGAGRPLTKGTGAALSDPNAPLTFPRNN